MGGGVSHRHAAAGRLKGALAVVGALFVLEAVVGVVTGSLALLSDAGHMLTDVAGITMALAAVTLAARVGTGGSRSYGLYRLEVLAALANAVLLFGVAVYVLVEAVLRVDDPPDLASGAVLVVALAGLAANGVAFGLLHEGARHNLSVRAALLEVTADLVGSVVVVVSAGLVAVTGWTVLDPVAGAALALWILPRGWRLAGEALRVLLQVAPRHVDLEVLRDELAALPAVVDVHDLHVWTLTSDMDVASAHLVVATSDDTHPTLDRARELLAERYGVDHATLQVEPADHTGCDELSW